MNSMRFFSLHILQPAASFHSVWHLCRCIVWNTTLKVPADVLWAADASCLVQIFKFDLLWCYIIPRVFVIFLRKNKNRRWLISRISRGSLLPLEWTIPAKCECFGMQNKFKEKWKWDYNTAEWKWAFSGVFWLDQTNWKVCVCVITTQ